MFLQGQDSLSKPPANQGMGNALNTYASISVIQHDAVPVVIVTTPPYQPAHYFALLRTQDRDGFKWR